MKTTRPRTYLYIILSAAGLCLPPHSARASHPQESTPDTQHIREMLDRLHYYSREKSDRDSAVFYQDKAFGLIPADKQGLSYDMLLRIAGQLVAQHNETGALEYYMYALSLTDHEAETVGDDTPEIVRRRIELYRKIAFCHRTYHPAQAADYWQQSLHWAETLYRDDPAYDIAGDRLTVYNNLGAVYSEQGRLDSAEHYYRRALDQLTPDDTLFFGKLYNNLGVVYARRDSLDRAFELFRRALPYAERSRDSVNLSNIRLNLGKSYYLAGDYRRTVEQLQQSLRLSRDVDNRRNLLFANEQLAAAYRRLGDTGRALDHLQTAYALKDSLIDLEKIRNSIDMELDYRYRKQQEAARHRQEMELQERETRTLFFMFLTLALLLVVVLLVLLYRMQRNRAQSILTERQRLALQNENLQLKKQALENELDMKQKEMDIHAQYLLKRGEFMTDVIRQISDTRPPQPDNELDKLLHDISSNIESSIWNEFQMLFQNLHNDFYTHLYERHPDLTTNEKRLCTFIHLNMTSKEISSITQQSVKSIEIARSRLRGKLGLKREDNLAAYLQQF